MASLNFINEVEEHSARLKSNEQMLGLGLRQPFNPTNSGSRKIMSGSHDHQELALKFGEKAISETGYEIRYGDLSSSILTMDSDYEVIAKISKFSFLPDHHYWLVLRNLHKPEVKLVEIMSYKFLIEVYGYMYNKSYADTLRVGDKIAKDTILRKSMGFDEWNNIKTGINFNTVYMADERNMEDSIIISDVAAAKAVSPIFKKGKAIQNENDIPLNLYGNENVYKVCPDIGEPIKGGILFAFRRELKEEAAYSLSYNRLRQVTMSDDKYTVGKGILIDIDVFCNNPDIIHNSIYNKQLAMYYEESMRVAAEIVTIGSRLMANGMKLDYEFEKRFVLSEKLIKKQKFVDDKKVPSFTSIQFMVLEERALEVGDKMADRYGGKGVVSHILPQYMMPKINTMNGKDVYADFIVNQSTMYGRENPGQNIELSSTYIGRCILDYIATNVLFVDESLDLIKKYYELIEPEIAEQFTEWTKFLDEKDKAMLVESYVQDYRIDYSCKPMSNSLNIDKLATMYQEFPFAKQQYLEVPIIDSNGQVRYVQSRRPTVMAPKYMRRLKQFAEEKFSATSLSATNITNLNSRSKASKEYKEPYPNTPIKFGPMESNNMGHLGIEELVTNLMIHSLSPHGRRMAEQMYTEDPFHVNIRLDEVAKNRSVEKVNTYLKTIGIRLRFVRIRKIASPAMTRQAIHFLVDPNMKVAIRDYRFKTAMENHQHMLNPTPENGLTPAMHFYPVKFYGSIQEQKDMWKEENK